MTTDLQKTGQWGEDAAINHLEAQNFTILDRNWRYGHLEVDIIARNDRFVIFCEVKTRNSAQVAAPETAVTWQKQRNLVKAAHHYVTVKNIPLEVRFDIITLLKRGEGYQLNHLEGAFTPRW